MHPAPDAPAEGGGTSRRVVATYACIVGVVLAAAFALAERTEKGLALFGGDVPFEFVPFALTLLGVALLHHHALRVALGGLAAIAAYKTGFVGGFDFAGHLGHEARIVLNLLGLLVGFALLADHFERSGLPARLPSLLPRGAKGAFVLLALAFDRSALHQNLPAAMMGGVAAKAAFRGRVTVAFVAAIVAASNAGGAGSVLGDTTTTMMWIAKVPALRVAPAFLASAVALAVAGTLAARAQVRVQDVVPDPGAAASPLDRARLGVVGLVLAGAVAANVLLNLPAAGVWAALLLCAPVRTPAWRDVPAAGRGAAFLCALVLSASMMPVDRLPPPSAWTTFGLGFVSSVFDNIPLTKLAIDQNGYDWALLAYAVGYGGSLTWFGSSAGVAITKEFPEARSLGRYLREGWPVLLAYVAGFLVALAALGFHPWSIPR